MESRIADLRDKEVVNIRDGSRFGFAGDVELDLGNGKARALVIPGRLRLFGLLGRRKDIVVPWTDIRHFGEDIILVDTDAASAYGQDEKEM
mgnify:CR=1 FL=1